MKKSLLNDQCSAYYLVCKFYKPRTTSSYNRNFIVHTCVAFNNLKQVITYLLINCLGLKRETQLSAIFLLLNTLSCPKKDRIIMSYGQKSEPPGLSMELTSVIDCRSDTVTRPSKGQLISKCPFGFTKLTKKPTNFL